MPIFIGGNEATELQLGNIRSGFNEIGITSKVWSTPTEGFTQGITVGEKYEALSLGSYNASDTGRAVQAGERRFFQRTGASTYTDLGDAVAFAPMSKISNINNTSDANKPISTATQSALNSKVSFLPDDTLTVQPTIMGGTVENGYFELLNPEGNVYVVQTSHNTDTIKQVLTLRRCTFVLKGWANPTGRIVLFNNTDGECDVTFDDVTFDCSGLVGSPPITFIRSYSPNSKFRGKVRLVMGANVLDSTAGNSGLLTYSGTGSNANLDLELNYEGDTDLSGTTDVRFFGVSRTTWPNFRATGSKTIAGIKRTLGRDAIQSITNDRTIDHGCNGVTYKCGGSSARTITLAKTAAVSTTVDFYQAGSGQFTFAAESGATVTGYPGLKLVGRVRAVVTTNTDGNSAVWELAGGLSA